MSSLKLTIAATEEMGVMTVIEQIAWVAQGQLISQETVPTSPSPEVLKALTDLMNAVRGHSSANDPASWWSPAGLKAVAAFIASVAWPVLALGVIVKFSPATRGSLEPDDQGRVARYKSRNPDRIEQGRRGSGPISRAKQGCQS